MGIGSMLSLPLRVQTDVIGSVNIYALRGDGFSALDAENVERFALPVAAAIRSAQATHKVDRLGRPDARDAPDGGCGHRRRAALLGEREHLPPSRDAEPVAAGR